MSILESVVIPFREPHQFLQQCVQSVLRDLSPRGEVLLVVDGPHPLAEIPFATHPAVRVLVLGRHMGTPVALNAGIERARGKYIVRLDSDDLAIPGRSDTLRALLDHDERLVAVGSQAVLIDGAGRDVGHLSMPQSPAAVRATLPKRNALIHSSVVYRRDAALALGGYDESCLRMQDYDLFLRLAAVGDLMNSDQSLIKYRIHEGMSSKVTSPYALYTRRVLRSQYALSRYNGNSPIEAGVRNLAWWAAQAARHHGLRSPRYAG